MRGCAKALTSLAVLAFILAVVATWGHPLLGIEGEGYSRACTNLAVLAIAILMSFGGKTNTGH
jgi:hypothetical protein